MNKRVYSRQLFAALVLTAVFLSIVVGLCGCSSKNGIVGTWAKCDSDGSPSTTTMSFYSDGTCVDTPVMTQTGANAVSYDFQEDGSIVFTMEWDGPKVFKVAESQEEALDNRKYYYLSGDTLILCGMTYVRQ